MPRSRSIKTQDEIQNPEKSNWTGVKDPSILEEIEFMPSTLETIDYAVYDYINNELNLATTSNKGFKEVPIIWASNERAYQLKAYKDLRDEEETLIYPLITLQRTAVTKDLATRVIPYANLYPPDDPRGGTITIARQINQKKTAEFQNNLSRKKMVDGRISGQGNGQNTFPNIVGERAVYETITIPLPVWVSVQYEISLRTDYQQQMNDLIIPLLRQGGLNSMPRRLHRDGHKFEAFIRGSFADNSNSGGLDMNPRVFETIVQIEVLGYLIGDGPNAERPKVVRRQNAVDVQIPRERVVLGDIDDYLDDRGFYRE
tara:strand:+ start:132 stop:1076 length:945 start_codon:yes stop_codon:yes gene_type:complete